MFCTGAYNEKEKQISRKLHHLAVIATDCGGLREQVVDGETGRLVPPRNCNAMADAMRQLISNPAAATGMGTAGRLHAYEIANLKQQSKQLIQVLTTLQTAGKKSLDNQRLSEAIRTASDQQPYTPSHNACYAF